ncbi:hypothetical protein [Bacillus andreraoultii]|uniref:hypothetical protein n=1 Tax=Bacillus andreraoultii TaxID=1499685 RepID=UPI000539D28D|nr:hypothetical protein [Bacillus andreraoultii]
MFKNILLISTITLTMVAGCSHEKLIKEQNKETVIEIPYRNYNHPVIHEGEMFVNVSNHTFNTYNVDSLIKYNMKTGKEELLYKSEYEESSMQKTEVNDDWLVWVDSSADGYNEKILSMNLLNGKIKTLAETNPKYLTILSPELYNHYVAWVELSHSNQIKVKLHNLTTNETIDVADINDYSLYNASVYLDNEYLLWTDTMNGKGYYYLYNVHSKKIENYQAPRAYPAYATYSDGKIFSINFDDQTDWTNQDFGYFDIETKTYHSLKHGDFINHFDTYKDKLVILDSNNKLYFYKMIKNKLNPIDINITEEENPVFASFDNDGHLIINFDITESMNKSRIGVVN